MKVLLSSELQAMKRRSGKTNKQIAEETGICESTVAKIINGETESPTWLNVIDIIKCLDGSADAVAGIKRTEESVSESIVRQYEARIRREQEIQDAAIQREQQITNEAIKRARMCSYGFLILFTVIAIILIIDAMNGGFGYINY